MERVKRGFSLLSLIVALAIVALLAAEAGDALRGRLEIGRAEHAAVRIEQLLRFARHAAMLQGQAIAVCLNNQNSDCTTEEISAGLSVRTASAPHTLLQSLRLEQPRARLRLRGAFGARRLRFAADGAAALSGSVHYCPENGRAELMRRISVAASGRVRVRPGAPENCR